MIYEVFGIYRDEPYNTKRLADFPTFAEAKNFIDKRKDDVLVNFKSLGIMEKSEIYSENLNKEVFSEYFIFLLDDFGNIDRLLFNSVSKYKFKERLEMIRQEKKDGIFTKKLTIYFDSTVELKEI